MTDSDLEHAVKVIDEENKRLFLEVERLRNNTEILEKVMEKLLHERNEARSEGERLRNQVAGMADTRRQLDEEIERLRATCDEYGLKLGHQEAEAERLRALLREGAEGNGLFKSACAQALSPQTEEARVCMVAGCDNVGVLVSQGGWACEEHLPQWVKDLRAKEKGGGS